MSTEQNKGLPTALGLVLRYNWVLAPLGLNPAAQRIPVKMGRFHPQLEDYWETKAVKREPCIAMYS